MAVNGKNKGNSFERKMANLLSLRFKGVTNIEQGFRRNPDSGSFFGASNQRRKETHDLDHANFGDLICPNNFNFSVECKSYKTAPTFTAISKGKIAQWDEWWKQATQDAENAKKEPMLLIKYNGIAEMCAFDYKVAGLKSVLVYNNMHLYLLSDVLTLGDNFFFTPDEILDKKDSKST